MKTTDRIGILIVEDERILAADMQERLETLGYDVCGRVGSGEEAVEVAGREGPDLVLMDIQLDGAMDGIEATALIKEKHDVPVIYLTAFADQTVLDRAKVTQPLGYLLKPIQSRELHSSIQVALYKAEVDREARRLNAELQAALEEVKQLSGLLPICANCKKIRDDEGYWQRIEGYIENHSEAHFTHSICPECKKKLYPEMCLSSPD